MILAIAVIYMLVQLDHDHARIEKDPEAGQLEPGSEAADADAESEVR